MAPRSRRGSVRAGDFGRLRTKRVTLLARQFRSPIILLLTAAALLSVFLGETTDSLIILAVVAISGLLGFAQESGAVRAVDALLESVRVHADVLRDGREVEVDLADVRPGDVVVLRPGDVVPGDGRIVEANNLTVDEAALTGETWPSRKRPGRAGDTDPAGRAFLGTHVAGGSGRMIVESTGEATRFGGVIERVVNQHVPTAFERGITAFGLLLVRATTILVAAVFVVNLSLGRPVDDSLMFSLALAVGLTPQMLPAIVTLSLSRGATFMARERVIVKRLDSIEDVGSLDVLCTDKTGTVTIGEVGLDSAIDARGEPSERVRELAWWNSRLQHGAPNPIDRAIVATEPPRSDGVEWSGEIPFDFSRRRVSVAFTRDGTWTIVTKGAVESVLACCCSVREPDGSTSSIDETRREILDLLDRLTSSGRRVLAVASGAWSRSVAFVPENERDLVLEGFLTFDDPPKPGVAEAIRNLLALGVTVKMITGDNHRVATHTASLIGLDSGAVLTGEMIDAASDVELEALAEDATIVAEVDPIQKERVLRALSRRGHTVGFIGDGINDAPALHAADVGFSVDGAVDVAKATADIVLLEKDLSVLVDGVRIGRRVFANTLKYVHVTTSANFGNMLSLAAATLLLPFLPLLPLQVLVLNFLSDIPGMTIATDRVDDEMLAVPHRWNIRRVRDFMIVFGLASSAFDLLTFAVLRLGFHGSAESVRSGWFVESTLTELTVMLVLRSRRPFFRSRPGTPLLVSSLVVVIATVTLPYSPIAAQLGLRAMSPGVLLALASITGGYLVATEVLKHWFGRLLIADDTGTDVGARVA